MNQVLKGTWGGNCNRTACQQPGAVWWNSSTRAYYCQSCARKINEFSEKADGYALCILSLDGQDGHRPTPMVPAGAGEGVQE